MHSLGSEVSLINLLLSLLLAAALATAIGLNLYDLEISNARTTMASDNQAVRYFIEGHFSEIRSAVQVLASNEHVRRADEDLASRREARRLFQAFEQANDHISYVYAGYRTGLLLINDYRPPEEYSPADRPWYRAAMSAAPSISTGTPYQDAIDGEWLVSVGRALPSRDGVVAIDSSVEEIAELLEEHAEGYETSYSFVTDGAGSILIHHDPNYLTRPLRELVEGTVNIDGDGGYFEYVLDGQTKMAIYSRLDEVGWVVITVVQQREILEPIKWNVVLVIGLIALAAGAVTVLQILILKRRFVRPVLELHQRVRAITEGREVPESDYAFPENEIGTTAGEVTQLAEHELLERSRRLQRMNEEIIAFNDALRQKNADLFRMSMLDQLSGLYNRRMVERELEREYRLSGRSGRGFSILMIDVDHFKQVNDRFGHRAGDEVLARIGALLRTTIRSTDIPGRWGGEEFLVLCPETDESGAARAAEGIRAAIETAELSIPKKVTVSIGASELAEDESVASLIERTDRKLYAAKAQGRNRVVT